MKSYQVTNERRWATKTIRVLRNLNLALYPITITRYLQHTALTRTLWTDYQIDTFNININLFNWTKITYNQMFHISYLNLMQSTKNGYKQHTKAIFE